jgi:glycosyltransferase involved in cell wall biosynthesis
VGDALTVRRVLVVARWYPAHDDAARGAYVADLVGALAGAGVESVVASFEPALVRGGIETRDERARTARVAWRRAVTDPAAVNVPRHWGTPGVAVARLPVVLASGERSTTDEVDAHADVLLAFGLALHARTPFDLVHAHTAIPDGVAAARLADALGLPLVVTEHASRVRDQLDDPDSVALMRGLAGRGRRLTAVSDHLGHMLEQRLALAAGRVPIVPNVVPEDVFGAAVAGPEPDPAADGPDAPQELLWVGARKETKGTDTLLRAFALVRAERPTVRLRMIGRAPTDEEESRWWAMVVDLGIDEAVAFDPQAARPDIARAMRRATLFVHPSPFETFGMVAAEALAVGLPVAATPSGVEAIVGTDGTCGEIAASHDPGDLARAILVALDRRDTYDPAVLRARVLARCGSRVVAAATMEVYAAAAGETAGRSAGGGRPADPGGTPAVDATTPADTLRADAGAAQAEAEAAAAEAEAAAAEAEAARTEAEAAAAEAEAARTEAEAAAVRVAPDARPVVVCLNRTVALRSIPRLPAAALAGAVVVTGPPTRQAPDPAPDGGRWIELDPAGAHRRRVEELTTQKDAGTVGRLRALASSGSRHRERDSLVADRDGWIEAARRRTLDGAREAAGGPAGSLPVAIVAVEADDVTAAAPLLEAGLPLAPGTLRWLADRADAATPLDAPTPPTEVPAGAGTDGRTAG